MTLLSQSAETAVLDYLEEATIDQIELFASKITDRLTPRADLPAIITRFEEKGIVFAWELSDPADPSSALVRAWCKRKRPA